MIKEVKLPNIDNPLVSVIVPVYNKEKTIRETLLSAIKQTYTNIEIIIIDDCSKDESISIAGELIASESRMKLITFKTNQGGSAARNAGIDTAKGDLVAFLDGDDIWHQDKIELQVNLWLNSCDRSRTAIYCKYYCIVNEKTNVLPKENINKNETISDYLFCNNGFMQTSGLLVPADLARKVKFRENLIRHQDYAFLMDLEAAGTKFLMVNIPLVKYFIERYSLKEKGWNPSISIDFLNEFKKSFSKSAKQKFLYNHLIIIPIRNKYSILSTASHAIRHINPLYLLKETVNRIISKFFRKKNGTA